jgi:hypothetical protein
MNFDAYRNTMPYPDRPAKPVMPKGDNAAEFRRYADEIENWNRLMEDYREASRQYDENTSKLEGDFKRDALEDVGLTGHPKADKAFQKAWEDGHSDGLYRVHAELEELADLLL